MSRKPQAGIWLTHLYIIQVIICHHQNTSNYSIQNSTTKDKDFSYATSHGVPNERRDFGFSRIPLKENVLHPYRTRKTCTTEFEESRITASVWLWKRLIFRPGCWSFDTFTMLKNMMIHFYLPPHISLQTTNRDIPSACSIFHKLPLTSDTIITNHAFYTGMIKHFWETIQAYKWKAEGALE